MFDRDRNLRTHLSSLSWRAIQNIAVTAGEFLTFFLLSRILPVEAFGRYASVLAIVGLGALLSNFGMANAFTIFIADQRARRRATRTVFTTPILLLTLTSTLLALMVYFAADLTPLPTRYSPLAQLIKLAAPLVILINLRAGLERVLQATDNFRSLAVSALLAAPVSIMFIVLLARMAGIEGALLGLTTSYLVALAILAVPIISTIKTEKSARLFSSDIAQTFGKQAPPFGVMELSFYSQSRALIVILTALQPSTMVAYYKVADTLFWLFFRPLEPITAVLQPLVVRLKAHTKHQELQRAFTLTMTATLVVSITAMLGYLILSPSVIPRLFPGYEPAVLIIRILALAFILEGVGRLAVNAFLIPGGFTSTAARIEVSRGILQVLFTTVGVLLLGITGAAISFVLVQNSISIVALRKTLDKLNLELNFEKPQSGPPTDLVLNLQNRHRIETFVETGTYYGNTALWATKHFDHVITIERSAEIYEQTQDELKTIENITHILGDSRDELKRIVNGLNEPAIFWLDSHWSGENTAGEGDECPVLYELKIIFSSDQQHLILVDDAHMFTSTPPPPHDPNQWPNIEEIYHVIGKNADYLTEIIEDVIVAVPLQDRLLLDRYMKKSLLNRLFEKPFTAD